MSKKVEITAPAIKVSCNNCDKNYKTTNTETFKCTYCDSRDIILKESTDMTYTAPDGDDSDL